MANRCEVALSEERKDNGVLVALGKNQTLAISLLFLRQANYN